MWVDGDALWIRSPLTGEVQHDRGVSWMARTGGVKGLDEFEGLVVKFELGLVGPPQKRKEDSQKKRNTAQCGWTLPVDEWSPAKLRERAAEAGVSVSEFSDRLRRAQDAVEAFRAATAFVPDEHYYDSQVDAVTHEVRQELGSARPHLLVRVDLTGPVVDADAGYVCVAYRKRWTRADERIWYDAGFALKVLLPDDSDRAQRLVAEKMEREARRRELDEEMWAAAWGITVEEWRVRKQEQDDLKERRRNATAENGVPEPWDEVKKKVSRRSRAQRTHEARKAMGWWYDEKGKRLSPSERARRKDEILASKDGGQATGGGRGIRVEADGNRTTRRQRGAATRKRRRASGYWYDELELRLPPEERARRKAEIEAQKGA